MSQPVRFEVNTQPDAPGIYVTATVIDSYPVTIGIELTDAEWDSIVARVEAQREVPCA